MARKVLIQIRRGLEKDIGTLTVGELGYCEDTSKLYIGTATGNVLLVAAQTVGDMLKSIYDTNNDGKVDMAEVADKVPWSGVTDKPDSLPADGGFADGFYMKDTRSVDDTPGDLIARKTFGMFKYRTSVGNPPVGSTATYVFIINIIGWSVSEGSGGYPVQIAVGKEGLAFRQGTSTTTWSNWTKMANIDNMPTKLSQLSGPLTCNDLKGV